MTRHWIWRSTRAAGIGGWLGAGALALALIIVGAPVEGFDEVVDYGVAGMIMGGLLFGPIIGSAVAAARSGETGSQGIGRAGMVGMFWGALGGFAVWGLHRGLGGDDAEAPEVALGGLIFGAFLGAFCGAMVTLYLRRQAGRP